MTKTRFQTRRACHPSDVKGYDTTRLRDEFLVDTIFVEDEVTMSLSMYDRFLLGGAMPVKETLKIEAAAELKADYFCERREIGFINIGAAGTITVDGVEYSVASKEAVYVGRGSKEILLKSLNSSDPAKFYFTSTPAHKEYPTVHVTKEVANVLNLGSLETSNERTIYQLIVPTTAPSCQLVMGLTELHKGSVWNTMPSHTHDRRMEGYFYFEVPTGQAVCHFMGEPQETRHLFVHNEMAVFSPEWGIHSGAGTSNYSFIWGMGGENQDYTDMDHVQADELR